MRFSLFARGDGLLVDSDLTYYAAFRDNRITDASHSARKLGVRRGMPVSAAQALHPELQLYEEADEPTETMRQVWSTALNHSPWLETVEKNALYVQIPGSEPPLRETRDWLREISQVINAEQTLRVGLAENPFLARALVEWSWVGRIPGALYRHVGRQQLIISPALNVGGLDQPVKDWFREMPVAALWVLPEQTRQALLLLNIRRLKDLEHVSDIHLRAHFGREALLWRRWLQQSAGGSVFVNYPAETYSECWEANVSESALITALPDLTQLLAEKLSERLQKQGLSAGKVTLCWHTEVGTAVYERVAKRPVHRKESIVALVQPGLDDVSAGVRIEKVEMTASSLRPSAVSQLRFLLQGGALVPEEAVANSELERVVSQMNRKFGHRLWRGLEPGFREQRLQAITGGADFSYDSTDTTVY